MNNSQTMAEGSVKWLTSKVLPLNCEEAWMESIQRETGHDKDGEMESRCLWITGVSGRCESKIAGRN